MRKNKSSGTEMILLYSAPGIQFPFNQCARSSLIKTASRWDFENAQLCQNICIKRGEERRNLHCTLKRLPATVVAHRQAPLTNFLNAYTLKPPLHQQGLVLNVRRVIWRSLSTYFRQTNLATYPAPLRACHLIGLNQCFSNSGAPWGRGYVEVPGGVGGVGRDRHPACSNA